MGIVLLAGLVLAGNPHGADIEDNDFAEFEDFDDGMCYVQQAWILFSLVPILLTMDWWILVYIKTTIVSFYDFIVVLNFSCHRILLWTHK